MLHSSSVFRMYTAAARRAALTAPASSYVSKNTVGSIPRVAQAQYDATTRVSRDDLLPGDLVFFGSSTSSISHVGIYVGSNQFIHAPSTGDVVKYSSLTGSYATRYQGAGRVIFE